MLSPPWFSFDRENHNRGKSASRLKWLIWECTKMSDLAINFHSIFKKACENIYSSSYDLIKYLTHIYVGLFWYRPFHLIQIVSSTSRLLCHYFFIPPINCFFLILSNSFMPVHREKCTRKILIPLYNYLEWYVCFFYFFSL